MRRDITIDGDDNSFERVYESHIHTSSSGLTIYVRLNFGEDTLVLPG